MKKRYIYSLLFGIPGLVISLIVAFMVFGAAAGFLWLFVFGDNSWPAITETILPLLLILTFLASWIASIIFGFKAGKKLEHEPTLNKKHVAASIGLTVLPLLSIIFHQLSVGNIGPKPVGQLCSDYCLEKGFSTSVMPPQESGEKSCGCLDESGRIILSIPVENLVQGE